MTRENKTILWSVLWLLCFSMAFLHTYMTDPTGDGFTKGMNRVAIFFGWQLAAVITAIVAVVVSRGLSKLESATLRRIGIVPVSVMGLGVMIIAGYITYNLFRAEESADVERTPNQPTATVPQPDQPTTLAPKPE